MPLPVFIVWGAAAAVTAVGGYCGFRGMGKFSSAKKKVSSAHQKHEIWKRRLEKERMRCEQKVERLVLRAAAIREFVAQVGSGVNERAHSRIGILRPANCDLKALQNPRLRLSSASR